MTGIRVDPDNNDIVVWKLDETAAPFINSSTSPSAISHAVSDLATFSGIANFQQPSPFSSMGANTCVTFTANNSGSPRNFISGANNVEPQSPVTFSFWYYLRNYNTTGFTQHPFTKQHTAGNWSSVFGQIGLQTRQYTSQPTAFDLFAATATGGGMVLDANNNIPLNQWCHIGLVYDGSFQYGYLNGNLVGQTAATGAINYGTHGPWFFGAIPSGSGNPEECASSICDIRIANVARPQSYFQNIYRQAMTTSGSGIPFTTYYKLRAYDNACSPPSPIYWVSTGINYTGATIPCGTLATLGPIEVLEKWGVLGFQNSTPTTVTDALNGLTWLLPNTGNVNSVACSTTASTTVSTVLPGSTVTLYNVTLRFRGVIEQKTYTGGTNDGAYFQTGGTPAADNWNIYQLDVSSPAQTFYLNRGTSGQTVVYPIDYTKIIQMNGGATITLTALSIDSVEIRNSGANPPYSISGITNPVQPYDGQFIQMGVVSVT